MLIQFTRDFRSAATNEEHYEAGAVADLPRGAEVVAEGAAVAVEPEAPAEPESKPKGRKV